MFSSQAKRSLSRLPFYDVAYGAYLYTFRRSYWDAHVGNLRRFYRQFVKPDNLVFDVGANVGEYARAFLYLGARVVSIEPEADAIEQLRRIRSECFSIIPCAVGAEPGELTLYVSPDNKMSSCRADWLDVLGRLDSSLSSTGETNGTPSQFVGSKTVPVVTLTSLIERHGRPNFLKIDVEGFEPQVLAGLDRATGIVSFEFNSAAIESALSCIQAKCFRPEHRFNYIVGEPARGQSLALPVWVTADQMLRITDRDLRNCRTYGDIFVRA